MSGALWTFDAFLAATSGRPLGIKPETISGISIDSRTLAPGDAFFERKPQCAERDDDGQSEKQRFRAHGLGGGRRGSFRRAGGVDRRAVEFLHRLLVLEVSLQAGEGGELCRGQHAARFRREGAPVGTRGRIWASAFGRGARVREELHHLFGLLRTQRFDAVKRRGEVGGEIERRPRAA